MENIFTILIWFFLFYLTPHLTFFITDLIKREFNRKKKINKNLPNVKPYKFIHKHFKNFVLKDSKQNSLFITIYIVLPFLVSIINTFILTDIILNIFLVIFAYVLFTLFIKTVVNKEYENYKKIINNILGHKQSKMSLVEKSSDFYTYKQEFEILEWNKDKTKPTKIKMIVPISFPTENRLSFLADFAEKFNYNGYWRVDSKDGWDDENNTVTLIWKKFFNKKQKEFIENFLEFKKKTMGLINNSNKIYTYYNEFEVPRWNKEKTQPEKVRLFIPIGFDHLTKNSFLDKMSSQFGHGRPWEVDNEDKKFPGWDTSNSVATIKKESPLPNFAPWTEEYVLNNTVQWSFFPLGIGSKQGIPFKDPVSKKKVRLIGFDVFGEQSKWSKKNNIIVGDDLIAAPHVLCAGVTGGGKSVLIRSSILSCLLRPKQWQLIIVDMKKVEGAMWREFGVPVSTTYEDSAILLTYAQSLMMERFEQMELRGINSWDKMPAHLRGPAIMIVVDEAAELLAPITGKSDIDKENADYQNQCRTAMESIARLGRAAMVHMFIAGQRPDAQSISMQIRQNSPVRIGAGSLPTTISQMVFESNYGATVPASPKGRVGMRIHSTPDNTFQGFFAEEEWFKNHLIKNNLPINVYGSNEMTKMYEENRQKAKENEELLGLEMNDSDYDLLGL